MSITNALNNAASGLAASARLADTISNNVANAMTDGFGRRTTEISSLSLGGYGSGARIGVTTRAESPYLTAERQRRDLGRPPAEAVGHRVGDVVRDGVRQTRRGREAGCGVVQRARDAHRAVVPRLGLAVSA